MDSPIIQAFDPYRGELSMGPDHPLFPIILSDTPVPDVSLDHDSATSLQQEGERALLTGDRRGLSFLEEAAKLDPSSSHLFFRQGLALFEFGARQNCLSTLRNGARKFKQATDLNPRFFEAWHACATTLELISKLSGRKEDLWEAKNKIEKAIQLVLPSHHDVAHELYWDAGVIYARLAEQSGEADELVKAIAYFEKSSGEPMPPEFWIDLGKAYFDLADLLNDIRLVVKAIQSYKQAISQSLSNSDGWIGLGRSLRRLFQSTNENDHFQQAYDCFTAASQLKPHAVDLLLEKIELMIEAARRLQESEKLWNALEKCERAALLIYPPIDVLSRTSVDLDKVSFVHPTYSRLLGLWAETLALLGEWNDRIDSIRQAEEKIEQALELEESPDLIIQYGKCLLSFANYYHDTDLYYQAIEQFQASLSLDRTQLEGWLWMGKAYATVFKTTDDLDALEKALRFYHKALQVKTDPFLYFEISSLLVQQGELQQNLDSIQQAIQYLEYLLQSHKMISYDHPEWFFYYGVALNLVGDVKEDTSFHHKALEALTHVLMFSPNYRGVHHRLGIVYSHLGEATDELDYFYRALQHFRLANRQAEDEEIIYIDWAITWMNLAEQATDAQMEENALREAEQKLIYAAKLGSRQAFYQLACLYSFKESFDLSLLYLHKAHLAKTLPPLEELQDDAWLEGVRLSPAFQEFLALLQKS